MTEADPHPCVAAALNTHRARLRRFVAARVPPSDVEDVLQLGALRALERAADLREPERVLAWLYRVHRNIATDLGRRKAREARLLATFAQDLQPVPEEDPKGCGCSLVQARELKPSYAAILDLVDIAGVSLSQAARALNISVNNATVRLHRARAALRRRLEARCGVTSVASSLDCGCTEEGCCTG